MSSIFSKLNIFFKKTLWEIREDSYEKPKKLLITVLRLLLKIGQEFLNGEIPLRASSLVYTTLLTFVPILAVAFSVVKALGVHNMLIPFMRNFLAPLGFTGPYRALADSQGCGTGYLGSLREERAHTQN